MAILAVNTATLPQMRYVVLLNAGELSHAFRPNGVQQGGASARLCASFDSLASPNSTRSSPRGVAGGGSPFSYIRTYRDVAYDGYCLAVPGAGREDDIVPRSRKAEPLTASKITSHSMQGRPASRPVEDGVCRH